MSDQRPEPEVTGNPSDGYERRLPGTGGRADAVRYQFYMIYRIADAPVIYRLGHYPQPPVPAEGVPSV